MIDLRHIDADTSRHGNNRFSFIGDDHFSHDAGELRAVRSGHHVNVSGDVDGDGHADFAIELRGHVHLSADDFIL